MLAVALAGCGGPAPNPGSEASSQAQREASVRVGDIVARANAIPTTSLGGSVAAQYGITRDAKTVMVLVSVRRGAQESAIPARVSTTTTDLLGKRQTITMREIRSGEFVDYVGVANLIAPDTLQFDIAIVAEHAQRMRLQFNRDFFP